MNDLTPNSEKGQHLTPEQYNVCFRKGTEPPFSGKYYKHKATGLYQCANCHTPLFSSDTKFDAGTGWPSFWDPVYKANITQSIDESHGMIRTEVQCAQCQAHLGHVFENPTVPSGKYYCINSLSLTFLPTSS